MSAPRTYQRGRRERHTKESENQPNVSPPVPVAHIQRGIVLIPDRDGTIPTKRSIGRVIQVPSKVLNEIVRPSRAGLVQRWVEDGELFGPACNLEAAVERKKQQWLGLFWGKE